MQLSLVPLSGEFTIAVQCAIPVFQGLLPEPHNTKILRLLFTFAHWHGLAKLRMHTDATLQILDVATTDLGKQLRAFQRDTCAGFETLELKREAEASETRRSQAGPSARHSQLKYDTQSTSTENTQSANVQSSRAGRLRIHHQDVWHYGFIHVCNCKYSLLMYISK